MNSYSTFGTQIEPIVEFHTFRYPTDDQLLVYPLF